MLKVTSDGDLSFVSKSLRIFSDSSDRDFIFIFDWCKFSVFSFMFMMRDETLFCAERYSCLELNVKCLPDFFYSFDVGDFYFEFANVAHHEEL